MLFSGPGIIIEGQLVLPALLRFIKRLIRRLIQTVKVCAFLREYRYTDTRRRRIFRIFARLKILEKSSLLFSFFPDCLVRHDIFQENEEFIAPDTSDNIGSPENGTDLLSERA